MSAGRQEASLPTHLSFDRAGCDVGDVGAEHFAIALRSPNCRLTSVNFFRELDEGVISTLAPFPTHLCCSP